MPTPPATTLHQSLTDQLQRLLDGGQAHATFADAVHDFPLALRSVVPQNLPYSAWQILEHIRIAQRDILDFSRNASSDNAAGTYQPRSWPASYWPTTPAPPADDAWDEAIGHVHADRKSFDELLEAASESDLTKPFPWGDGQTLLREAFLIADHNAYHVGELIILRRLLGAWKK